MCTGGAKLFALRVIDYVNENDCNSSSGICALSEHWSLRRINSSLHKISNFLRVIPME